MSRVLVPRGPCCSSKKVESTDFELYFGDLLTDHIICGFTLSVGCGTRAIDVAAGSGRVLGLHTQNTVACTCALTCLAVCDVHHIYIQVNRDAMCRPCDWTFASNTTGTTPTDALKIGTATTDCTTTTASVTTIGSAKETGIGQGTAFPTEYATDTLFWRTDENKLYKNIGTELIPTWGFPSTDIETGCNSIFQHSICICDYTTPCAAVATSGIQAAQCIDGGCGDFWTDNTIVAARRMDCLVAGANISFTAVRVGSAVGCARMAIYDECCCSPNNLVQCLGSKAMVGGFLKFTVCPEVTIPCSGTLYIAAQHNNNGGNFKRCLCEACDGEFKTVAFGCAMPDPWGCECCTKPPQMAIYYSGAVDNAIDNIVTTRWESDCEVAPAIYFDMGSAKDMSSIAIYHHSNTTSTQVKIRASTDAVFTDPEIVRTINTSDLIACSWNFIRFNRLPEDSRYIQVIGTDACSAVLAVSESKVLIPTSCSWTRRHGHLAIDTTDPNLDLDGSTG